jgi:hypothetical protein
LCDSHVVNLDLLPHDLASAADTANYTFITPDLCDDGHNATCANGGPGGLAAVNLFLEKWVPMITSSPAYADQNGLLIITFDESTGSDTSSCCGEIPGPVDGRPGLGGPGGGDVGAVLLSPCIRPGTVTQAPYNHYTMLRSVEDIFGLGHIGYAQLPGETDFGADVFTGPCSPPPTEHVSIQAGRRHGRSEQLTVRWRTSGTPATSYTVEVRPTRRRGSRWRVLARSTTRTSLSYRAARGHRYQFRIRGTGLAGTGPYATATVTVRY